MRDPVPECVEIVCENHEDVLIRLQSGKYVAVQVKTRKLDQALFKATDPAVKKAIVRFARLEHSYPNRFEAFKFITNFDYWKDEETQENLPFLLKLIQAKGSAKGWRTTSPIKSYAKIICDEYAVLEESVLAVLLKLRSEAHESGLDHTSHELIENLTKHSTLEAYNAQKVHDVAAALLFRVYTASSKVMGGSTIDLYNVVADHASVRDHLILQGKILTTNMITELIAHVLKESTSALLGFHESVSAQVLLAGVGVLTEKMMRGGLQTERINKVKDYKASAETAYLRWRHKFSLNEANQRLTHLKTIVEDDCIEAKLAAKNISKDLSYGPEMYVD
ncbi:MAG: dsDNA nuclease domain-containing protein, partial [Candidatus Angelobacter sp.]